MTKQTDAQLHRRKFHSRFRFGYFQQSGSQSVVVGDDQITIEHLQKTPIRGVGVTILITTTNIDISGIEISIGRVQVIHQVQ